jgi:DNA-binding IclR family transcriptional regulator
MSRPALSATRAMGILHFLAAHPTEAFSLSDLSDRLGVNVASMHAVLTVLTDDGYLLRHPRHRTYRLGPAVVALGTAALEAHPAIDIARDAARTLAAETGLEVAVTTLAGDDQIVFLARAGEPSPRSVPIHVGQRTPFVPPLGSVFVAWGDAAEWLARSTDPAALALVLEAVRARGYSIALEVETRIRLGQALDELAAAPSSAALQANVGTLVEDLGRRRYHVRELADDERYDVSMIAAPVFDAAGEVLLALTLIGFSPSLTGREVAAVGAQVRDAALVVTRRSRGRVPSA